MRRLLTMTALLALASCAMSTGPNAPAGYLVFFTERSTVLEPAAVTVIANAAAAAKASPDRSVLVRGYTDSAGSKPDDVKLSQERANAVANALAADGVAASRISQQGRGQTGKDPGVESRRVEITLSN